MNLLIKMSNNLVFINIFSLVISSTCARNILYGAAGARENGDFDSAWPLWNLPHTFGVVRHQNYFSNIDSTTYPPNRMSKQQVTLESKSFISAPKTCGSENERLDPDGNCQEIIDFQCCVKRELFLRVITLLSTREKKKFFSGN